MDLATPGPGASVPSFLYRRHGPHGASFFCKTAPRPTLPPRPLEGRRKVKAKATGGEPRRRSRKPKPKAAEAACEAHAGEKSGERPPTPKAARPPKATKAPQERQEERPKTPRKRQSRAREGATQAEGASSARKAAGDRREPREAKTINQVPRLELRGAGVGRPHPRPADQSRRRAPSSRCPEVDLEHGFRPTYVVLTNKSKTVAEPQAAGEERVAGVVRNGLGPRGRRSPGTSRRSCASRRRPPAGWCSTRSRSGPCTGVRQPAADRSSARSTPSRRAASSTASSATRRRRCCGRRWRAGCRPAACSRSRSS